MKLIHAGMCLLSVLIIASCKPKNPESKPAVEDTGAGYFSIRDYAFDQWNVYHGQPYGMVKYTYLNGKTDSVNTNAYDVDWAAIFKIFFESDISDKKFLDKYTFSSFVDETTVTENYYYEAKEKGLFTQKLHLMADEETHRIKSVYIETAKNTKWGTRTQRLFYIPIKIVSIQEFESTATGDKKELRVEYRFM